MGGHCAPLAGCSPLASGLLARLPLKLLPTGLPALDPTGVPLLEFEVGGLSFNFFVFPLSLISPPEPATSTSLPDPEPSGRFRTRFLPWADGDKGRDVG